MTDISNSDYIIDSRDVIERIEELREEHDDLVADIELPAFMTARPRWSRPSPCIAPRTSGKSPVLLLLRQTANGRAVVGARDSVSDRAPTRWPRPG
ncbi:MAG: hypothetical protein ACREA0_18400 [bacterium]